MRTAITGFAGLIGSEAVKCRRFFSRRLSHWAGTWHSAAWFPFLPDDLRSKKSAVSGLRIQGKQVRDNIHSFDLRSICGIHRIIRAGEGPPQNRLSIACSRALLPEPTLRAAMIRLMFPLWPGKAKSSGKDRSCLKESA
jgi:hypothetical protein